MKNLFKIITAFVLIISLVLPSISIKVSANENVAPGIYNLEDSPASYLDINTFIKLSNKDKAMKLLKGWVVLGNDLVVKGLDVLSFNDAQLEGSIITVNELESLYQVTIDSNGNVTYNNTLKTQVFPSNEVPINYNADSFRLVVSLGSLGSSLKEHNIDNNTSSLKLYKKNNNGTWTVLGSLLDSGNLNEHSDEIANDGNFSIKLKGLIDTLTPGTGDYKVEAEFNNGQIISSNLSISVVGISEGENVKAIINSFEETEAAAHGLSGQEATVENVQEVMSGVLTAQANVKEVKAVEKGILEIEYDNGLSSVLQIIEETGDDNAIKSLATTEEIEEVDTFITENRIETSNSNPIEIQTTGEELQVTESIPEENRVILNIDSTKEIGSRNVLLWAPYSSEFAPYNEDVELETIFENSSLGFNVDVKRNSAADVESLKNLTNYGFVLLTTHGSGGKWVLTGEVVEDYSKYEIEQITKQMTITQHMFVSPSGVKVKKPVYAVNEKWFANNLNGTFANSVIFNSSCESTITSNLSSVFLSKGAKAYLGFDDLVYSSFAEKKAIEFATALIDGKTVGQAFTGGNDPKSGAAYNLVGDSEVYFQTLNENQSNLLNGGFEYGLQAWQVNGDGRAITGIGNPLTVKPVSGEGMGILSTGLGYTEALGEMSQTFYLSPNANTLTFNHNYISDEFLYWIGSGFNDPLTVTLTADGVTEEVLELNVNKIAEQYNANKYDGGNLVDVTGRIVFDSDDVWMTGWDKHVYTIPAHLKGKVVTLTFSLVDAQDTVFDTAVLLDNISIQ